MLLIGQAAITLAPEWSLNTDMLSLLDPNATFVAQGIPPLIEPINPGILTQPAWGNLFLTPQAVIPTRTIVTFTPTAVSTPLPPPVPATPVESPEPTATLAGPIIIPTRVGPSIADLAVEISDNSPTYTPGTSIRYTIIVKNLGPDDVLRFDIRDEVPTAITGITVNCTPAAFCGTNTSSGNTVSFTGARLPYNSGNNQITITINGTIPSSITGNLVNSVEVIVQNTNRFQDPFPSNNTATDTDTQLSVYDLAITKSDGSNTFTATSPVIYTIVATNSGPSDALNIRVTDTIPAQISSWTWACTNVTNASRCTGTTGSSNFNDTVDIRSGGRIEYTVTAFPAGIAQNLSNTATIIYPSGPRFTDPNPANNSATDTDIPYIDLLITKDDGTTSYTPGITVTYTVTVTNNSTFGLTNVTVTDTIPTLLDPLTWTWTCAPAPGSVGAACTSGPSNTSINDTAVNLPPNTSVVYSITATVLSTATGNLSNTASVTAPAGLVDAVPGNNAATDTDTPGVNVDLAITKTDGTGTYTPGGPVSYTVTVTNNSAVAVNGATVIDNIPALIDPLTWSWSCAPVGFCATPAGTGSINTIVNLPSLASVNITINATVSGTATGNLSNTATVSAPAGFVDTVPGNNSATDTDVSAGGGGGEPDIGPPDGEVYIIPQGESAAFPLSQPIVANGDAAADFVFYELPMAPGINLDHIVIEVSTDGSVWYQVFFWGNTIADTNTNVDNVNLPNIAAACPTEDDNCPIDSGDLYNNTGITIDVDNSPLSGAIPLGNYFWIRFTEPALPGSSGDNAHVDAIEILP